MLGSSASISDTNVALNTAAAEILRQFADELENAEDFEKSLHNLIKRVIKNHKRIIFNGNGYDDKWLAEAKERGLLNLQSTPDAMPYFISEKNISLLKWEREEPSLESLFMEVSQK
jgi:glutamine synthetase